MAASSPQLPLALRYPPDQRLETFFPVDGAVAAQLRAFAAEGGKVVIDGEALVMPTSRTPRPG